MKIFILRLLRYSCSYTYTTENRLYNRLVSIEVISCGSLHTDDSSIGSEEQTTELREAGEAGKFHEITADTTQTPAIAGTKQSLACFKVS